MCNPCPHGKLKQNCATCKAARASSKGVKREPKSSPEIKQEPEIKPEPEIKQEPFTIQGACRKQYCFRQDDKLSLPQLQTKLKIEGIDLTITSIKKKLIDMGHSETKFKRDWNPAKEKKIYYLNGAKLATADEHQPLVFSNNH